MKARPLKNSVWLPKKWYIVVEGPCSRPSCKPEQKFVRLEGLRPYSWYNVNLFEIVK